MPDKDLFGNPVQVVYFKATTYDKDDGWMMCSCYCGKDNIGNSDNYVVTTNHLKADEVPEQCQDAKEFAELVAKLLNEYFNKTK